MFLTVIGSNSKRSTMSPENNVFGIKKLKIKVMSHKSIAGVRLCTLVSAGFF